MSHVGFVTRIVLFLFLLIRTALARSLAPLVKKVHEGRVVEIVESLCQKLLTGKEQQRDTASIALKTVVADIPSGNVAQSVVVYLTPKLIKGITNSVCLEALLHLSSICYTCGVYNLFSECSNALGYQVL